MMQMTETHVQTFDARLLSAQDEPAVLALTGGSGLANAPGLPTLLHRAMVLGDYAGLPALQAAAALLPLYGQTPLALSLRAAGFGADGQGAVLTPPSLADGYTEVRHFLHMALRWAGQQYASYHLWAVLPYDAAAPAASEELCAQYLAAGLSLRGLCPMDGAARMMVFAARPLPRWEDPIKKLHLADPALPRMLERGYAAADFCWDRGGMLLMLRPTRY